MASLSENEQRKLAYFHALSKSMTENTQDPYESKYKSSHNIRLNEVWSDNVGYAVDEAAAVAEAVSNSAVTLFHMVELDMIYGSNGQSYCYISGGTFKDNSFPIPERGQVTTGGVFIRPWISPTDIPHPTTNEPSYGYQLKLFRQDNTPIFLTQGAWVVDYYAGIIHFAQNYTPDDLGWGNIKATFFQYTGNYGASGGTSDAFTSAVFNSGTSTITFNSGETTEVVLDLSSLSGGTEGAFTTAIFNSGTNMLIFNSGETTQTLVDLSALKNVSGTTSLISTSNSNMSALNTSFGSPLSCSTALFTNISGSKVCVFINGIQVSVGSSSTDSCYFSDDGGITKRNSGDEVAGDLLYWNYDISNNPVAGYELSASVDKVTFLNLKL